MSDSLFCFVFFQLLFWRVWGSWLLGKLVTLRGLGFDFGFKTGFGPCFEAVGYL